MNNTEPKTDNQTNEWLLSHSNHPLVVECMENGSLGSLNDLKDPQGNFSDNDKASIIAQIFMADIIADVFNEKVSKNNPITRYTANFEVLEQSEWLDWWFAEQSVLWATDAGEREYRSYWAKLLAMAVNDELSSCTYEIDRYDCILQTLKDGKTLAGFNPHQAFGIRSYDEFDFINECKEFADEMTGDEVAKLKALDHQKLLLCIIDLGKDYHLSMDFRTVHGLYNLAVNYLDLQEHLVTVTKRYVTIEVKETVISKFVVEVDDVSEFDTENDISEKACELLDELNDKGIISYGDGDLHINTKPIKCQLDKPFCDYLSKDHLRN